MGAILFGISVLEKDLQWKITDLLDSLRPIAQKWNSDIQDDW